jgi:hypothetical protein
MQQGWSTTAAAHAAGISPLAAKRWCAELTDAAGTWLRIISTFGAEVRVIRGEESWGIQCHPVSHPVRERQRRSWRHRRLVHYIQVLSAQSPKMKRNEKETRASFYVANEEARIVAGTEDAKRRMSTVLLSGEMESMRAAVKALIRASHITTDELAFAAGVSNDAVTSANDAQDDGRLLPLRKLLAAVDARLEVHLPSSNRIVIARSEVEPDKPSPSSIPPSGRRASAPVDHDGSEIRSQLGREKILALYDAGIPITKIAELAGISRQRVHSIAKSTGRTLRRTTAIEERSRSAELLLS